MNRLTSRTKKSFFNVASNFSISITKSILSFVTRTIFIKILGETALGLNGLFSNILSMLSLAELGIGTAINFSLYEPLVNKNIKEINSLMAFYRRVYKLVGLFEIIIGLLLIPFLGVFIKSINEINNVYLIYILYLLNTASTYFIAYKETLINADQKNYMLTKINIFFLVVMNLFQIVILVLFKNYIAYLIIQFIIQLIQMIYTNIFISKQYAYVDFKSNEKLSEKNKRVIKKNVKAMFFHKIGDYCINGTDNLVISSFINLETVGLYSNYLMIINIINSYVATAFNAVTASLGNLIVTESDDRKEEVFRKLNFIAYLLYGTCTVGLISVFSSFITLWIGNKYTLDGITTIVIVLNFYLTGMRIPIQSMKSAAGLFDVDKYTPLIQSFINLVISIVLAQKIGLLGVLLGTLISSIVLPCWQRPYLIYKFVLHKSCKSYFINYIKQCFITFFSAFIVHFILSFIMIENLFFLFLVQGTLSVVVFWLFTYLFYRNSEEFKYLINLILRR